MVQEKRRAPALLVMDDSPDLAQRVLSVLRNRGIVVHTHHADKMETLARLLGSESPAAVVLQHKPGHAERAAQVRKQLEKYPDVPLVMLIDSFNTEGLCDALTAVPEAILDEEEDDQLVTSLQRIIETKDEIERLRLGQGRMDELEERYNLLLESSREAIAYIHEGLHIYANSAYLELFGYPAFADIEGVSLLELLRPEGEGSDLRQILKNLNHGELPDTALEFSASSADGDAFPCTVEFSHSRYSGETCTQLQVRRRAEAVDPAIAIELEKLKTTDIQTGMHNRQAFMGHLSPRIEACGQQQAALLFVELDRYEKAMERLGTMAAERLIAEAATVLQSCLEPEQDLCCRYGDHTFAFFVERADREQIEAVAKCFVDKLAVKPLELDEATVSATCSVGFSLVGSHNRSPDLLLSQAISAWQEAVSNGGNSFTRYRPKLGSEKGDDQLQVWAERLRHALDNDQLVLALSAITNMEDESEQFFEVLIKMRQEDSDELIDAAQFMPAAGSIGLGGEVDRFVLKRLLTAPQKNNDARYLLNITSATITATDFSSWLENFAAAGSRLKLAQMILLMNPQEIATNLRPAQQFMDQLGPKGVAFGLNDYGKSEDSERVLQHLPVEFVRVHPTFTNKLNDNNALTRLRNLVDQAKGNQAKVIAPDVTDATSLSTLWQTGITLVQGNFLGQEQLLPS